MAKKITTIIFPKVTKKEREAGVTRYGGGFVKRPLKNERRIKWQ